MNYPSVHATLDLGALLPMDHSSVWLRLAGGHSFGDARNPLPTSTSADSETTISTTPRRSTATASTTAFPGVELNAIGGTNFGRALLEWTIPPARFKRIGVPSLYANWARLALFASGIATDMESDEHRRTLGNAGAQVNVKLVLFSSLESTLSLGYARAFEEGAETSDELMISLKILR